MNRPLDFATVRRQIDDGTFSAEDLTRVILDRIAAENHRSHIFISVDPDGAIAAARAADLRRQAGAMRGPLDGIPVAIKDNIDVAGMATTDGTWQFRDRIAGSDAACVARLRAGGAVLIGKLNMHEGALGATTDNPFWGRCDNPSLPGHTPGGSSGGSGAAVAAGLAVLSLGTDTMGSVRIPAAYCGVWGLKPTPGVIATSGLSHLSWTLDTIGPLAASAAGLRAALDAMRGEASPIHDGSDARAGDGTGRTVVLGLPDAALLAGCTSPVRDAFEALLARLPTRGISTRPVAIGPWDPGRARRAGLLVSEAEGGFLLGAELDKGTDGFSETYRALLTYGRTASAERLAGAYWLLRTIRTATLEALDTVDAILMPTAPQTAFPHGTPAPADQADLTALANIAGCPALAFPLPASDDTAPTSAQLLGRPLSEHRLLSIASDLTE
jgi:aspartyl-tRNA(Asn)/glutamyl-tRNA(Gln) amidotransferase subunit A